jgi:hypothetical protein
MLFLAVNYQLSAYDHDRLVRPVRYFPAWREMGDELRAMFNGTQRAILTAKR